jgi:threonine synthase
MKYVSTRGDPSNSFSFEHALCSGYAVDGGLFVPEKLPSIRQETVMHWSTLPYPKLAFEVLRLFVSPDEIPDSSLLDICIAAFANGFDNIGGADNAVPVIKLGSLYVAELFHGPTFCFKDLG